MIRCARFAALGLTLALLSACGAGVSQSRPPGAVTAYVVNEGSNTVTALSTRTGRVIKKIKVGGMPSAIAITPDGRTAYVTTPQDYSGTVTPIDLATGVPGPPIDLIQGQVPAGIAISSDGAAIYVTTIVPSDSTVPTQALGTMTVIRADSDGPERTINAGDNPGAIAITPDGTTAYVGTAYSDESSAVTPIQLPAGTRGKPIPVGGGANAIALTSGADSAGAR
jgi:YVTN family beta-propeller protein